MLWTTVVTGAVSLVKSWFETKKAKQEAEVALHQQLAKTEADWDVIAQRQAQYSWKDELITCIWFAPLVVAWFDPERSMEWVDFVSELPIWYQFGMFGIIAASFGLRWYFKQQGFKVGGKAIASPTPR